uniref:ATP-binding protein n=1 Tax=Streptomyces polyasparticus TaxID=2767826 RepID=UPI00280B5E8E|nr:ATP-binding protein [Streptomyces polyasparticus]
MTAEQPKASASLTLTRVLLATEKTAGAARQFARGNIPSHIAPDVADDFVLIVSEIVTNAARYGTEPGDSLRIVLAFLPDRLRVEVHDTRRRPPRFRPESAERQRGRGLFIVDSLAAAWGVGDRPFGKVVWAEVKA